MLNLNRSRTEYRVRMYWFKLLNSKNGVLNYAPKGLPFSCSYSISQDSSYVSFGQGIIYNNILIETVADYPFKKNDKVSYLGHTYIVKNITIQPNPITGSDYTNKPSAIVKNIELEG